MPRQPSPWAEIAPLLNSMVVRKFRERIEQGEDHECWPWKGQLNAGGYGMFYVSGRRTGVLVTRIAYYLANKTIADDQFVCHSCDNPTCCNPKHLWLGTHKQNIGDMWQKGRANPWNKGLKLGPRKRATLLLLAWLMSQHLKEMREAQEEEDRLNVPLDQFIAAHKAEYPNEHLQ